MLVRLNLRPADAPGGLNIVRDNWLYTPNTKPQTLNRDKLAHAALFILLNARGPAEASGILASLNHVFNETCSRGVRMSSV